MLSGDGEALAGTSLRDATAAERPVLLTCSACELAPPPQGSAAAERPGYRVDTVATAGNLIQASAAPALRTAPSGDYIAY